MGVGELATSVVGTLIILTAMAVGRWLRERISQDLFRKALLLALIVMGLNMIRRAFL